MFALLVELNVIFCTKVDTVGIAKLSQQSLCHSWQNIRDEQTVKFSSPSPVLMKLNPIQS